MELLLPAFQLFHDLIHAYNLPILLKHLFFKSHLQMEQFSHFESPHPREVLHEILNECLPELILNFGRESFRPEVSLKQSDNIELKELWVSFLEVIFAVAVDLRREHIHLRTAMQDIQSVVGVILIGYRLNHFFIELIEHFREVYVDGSEHFDLFISGSP